LSTRLSTFPTEEIANLRQVLQIGPTLFGYVVVDEEGFFVCMAKLKKSLAGFKIAPAEDSNLPQPFDIYRQMEEIEQMMETASVHVFGKAPIKPGNFLRCIDQLEFSLKQVAACAASTELDEVFPILSPNEMATLEKELEQPEQTVENAKAEAERIIAEAKREAERIKEEARRKAEQPWLVE
jgi:hypothetical protein